MWKHVEYKQCLSYNPEVARETKISRGTNILRTTRYCFPTDVPSKGNIALSNKDQNHSYVLDLGN